MLMMRSTPATKMGGKPPPPVPPRPSKNLVAEALAKRRKEPNRIAPDPPGIFKSKSSVQIEPVKLRPVNYERSISEEIKCNSRPVVYQSKVEVKQEKEKEKEIVETEENTNSLEKKWDNSLNDRNHVNTLIDEMFASVLSCNDDSSSNSSCVGSGEDREVAKTIIVIKDEEDSETSERKVKFDDKMNHELLISELQKMKVDQDRILKRQRKPSLTFFDKDKDKDMGDGGKISCSDWVEVSGGQEVKLTSCQITIEHAGSTKEEDVAVNCERIKQMSSLHGLPPLPKSLSGFSLLEGQAKPSTPARTSSMRQPAHLVYPPHPKSFSSSPEVTTPTPTQTPGRKSTNLDAQLAILRREMYSLRQLDLSLLSQLWSLNESIHDFRQILQDQEDRVLSPPSPSPTPSSGEDAEDEFYMSKPLNFRPAPPPPPVRRPSSSSNASSLG